MSADRFPRPTGSLSARIKGAEIILRERQRSARVKAAVLPKDSHEGAALRGKAHGYGEAAELLSRIDRGRLLGFRRWTRKERSAS